MPKTSNKNRYLLIDGNALIHRGYHAIPALSTKDGEPTNAVYGFTMILLRAIKDLKPTHIACSFDLSGPTFRHIEHEHYKATRVKQSQDLYDQFPRVKEVVRALNIPIFEIEGFEADDVLGTLAVNICEQHPNGDCDVMIATGDLDTLQLVNNCVKVYTLRKGLTDTAIYDEQAIFDRYGLTPKQMISYKALRGDPSDNIKGVKGIGEKSAGDLIKEFGDIDGLYNAIKSGKGIENIKPRVLKLLVDGEKDARDSFYLSTIILDVPLKIQIDPYQFGSKDLAATTKIFSELEFRSLLDKLPKNYAAAKSDDAAVVEEGTEPVNVDIGKQDYQLIDDTSKLVPLLKKLDKQTEIVIDTETDQLNQIEANIIGISLSFKSGEAYYITVEVLNQSKELRDLISSSKLKKSGQNIKYDYHTFSNLGLELSPLHFDTMLAAYLINSGTRQYGLDAMAFNLLGYQMQSITELIGKGKNQISMKDVPVEKVSWYAAEDADMTLRIKEILEKELKKEKLEKVFFDIEMPLIPVLARMERAGIKVNAEFLKELSEEAGKELAKLEKNIYKQAGEEFNINSPKQLQEILYKKLGLTSGKKNKTGLSTAAGQLDKMRDEHPIVNEILNYRELAKLKSTYLDSLPELINSRTDRIHTNYNQTIAATGRLSSTDPNLQNIPIKGDGMGSKVRQAFVAEKGYKLVSLDYSQIELRIAAHLSGDKNMKKIFANNEDIHTQTAMALFDVKEDKVVPDMRRYAKTVNFGILYGLSSFGFSDRVSGVSVGEAKDFIDKYFKAFPKIQDYMEATKMQVREDAMVCSETGRVRKFPEIKSPQYFIRQAAERAAINFPIQSLSADIIKVAMIEIDKLLRGKDDEVRMLLQVHDELVFEIAEDKVEPWIEKIKPLMENAIKLSVPVIVEAKVGDNWGEMEKK
ncbi:DNA polymerase I [bacterium]|nr:MAG: DNA polymerase I [bacterium]